MNVINPKDYYPDGYIDDEFECEECEGTGYVLSRTLNDEVKCECQYWDGDRE